MLAYCWLLCIIYCLLGTEDEINHIIPTEESVPVKESLSLVSSEAHSHMYLNQASDKLGHNFRPRGSLVRIIALWAENLAIRRKISYGFKF